MYLNGGMCYSAVWSDYFAVHSGQSGLTLIGGSIERRSGICVGACEGALWGYRISLGEKLRVIRPECKYIMVLPGS